MSEVRGSQRHPSPSVRHVACRRRQRQVRTLAPNTRARITDLAVIDVTPDGLVLRELAQGHSVAEVRAATEARLTEAAELNEMQTGVIA
jgi:acyl CoA:acetate/3-ketoacid CoA transferase beta subunit